MEKYKKTAYIGVTILIYLALSYIFLKYALGIILPFAISFSIVLLSRPIIDKISKYTRVPKGVVGIFVIGIMLILLTYALILATSALLEQIGSIIYEVGEHLSREDNYITGALGFLEQLADKFPFLKNNLPENSTVYDVALEMALNAISTVSTGLTHAVGRIIASTPEMIVTVIVIILSLFYFSKDYRKISTFVMTHLPISVRERLPRVKRDILFVMSSYLRSYIMLLFITFAEVFAGLLILGVKNAFAISVVAALVDLLPVIGVGTVLVPWSIISFVTGNATLGIGLLILFAIVYVVRQIIEPRIVSSQMNIHPLIAIFAMYAGLKLAGIGGMIVAPFFAFAVKTLYDGLKKDNEKKKDVEKEEKL